VLGVPGRQSARPGAASFVADQIFDGLAIAAAIAVGIDEFMRAK
jgi:hypothetical protein